MIYLFSWI